MALTDAERDVDWIGCIDFGTALSKVAVVQRIERASLTADCIRPLPVGLRSGFTPANPFLCPSMLFIHPDRTVFGLEAETDARRGEVRGRHAFASLKQYLSTGQLDELDAPLPEDIDPTGRFTARTALMVYLAHLLERAGAGAQAVGAPWPARLRIARPAWAPERASAGEAALKELVVAGFRLVDLFGSRLSAARGIPNDDLLQAVGQVTQNRTPVRRDFFETDTNGAASVLEATAVAAGAIRSTGRRIVIVVDVGGGTTDFGAFMTGMRNQDVLAEIAGSASVLRKAGDHLDMLLKGHVLQKLGYDGEDPAARGAAGDLRRRQRAYKEELFSTGEVTIRVDDTLVVLGLEEFLANPRVGMFAQELRDRFEPTLNAAITWAQGLSGPRIPIEFLFTGGGHALPMVRALRDVANARWVARVVAPDLAERSGDPDFDAVRRQIAVAIGGAMADLPVIAGPLR